MCKQTQIVAVVFFPLNMRILYEQGNHAELVINFSDARDVCGHVGYG